MMTDRVILISTIIIAVVYFYATTLIPSLEIGDPLGPKAFPRLLGFALLLAASMLALELWKQRKTAASQSRDESPFEWRVVRVIACVAVWTGLYYVAFQPLGYIAATAVYLLGLMAWFNRGKWVANVITSVLFAGLSYFMFVKLDVNLPKGILPFF
jgi:putative tricarboxylic transport membrane protein